MNLRLLETRLRSWRKAGMKRLFNGPGARKQLLDALPNAVSRVTMDFGDHVLTFDPHELVGRRIFTFNAFERAHTDTVLAWLAENGFLRDGRRRIVEIGANIGTQTVYFCLNGAVEAVLAIEPDPENVGVLRRNIEDNALEARVSICTAAIGEERGSLVLHKVKGNSGNSSLVALPNSKPSGLVEVVPLADALAQARFAPSDIAMVWVDTEGYEPNLWPSIVPLIEAGAAVHLEFSPGMYGAAATHRFVGEMGRLVDSVVIFDGPRPRQVPVSELLGRNDQIDILIGLGLKKTR
jgi:FkbM family methyltransferase